MNDEHREDPPLPEVSLIIPAYNEEAYLPTLLASIDVAQRQYRSGCNAIEIIVANNGSTDDTAEVARRHGCMVVDIAERSIGAARNGGATVARGTVLCFVDADTVIHPGTFSAIADAIKFPHVAGGATGLRTKRSSPALRILSLIAVPARLLGADWGLVFCRRSAFDSINGYRSDLLAGEDLDFLLRLRRYAKTQGQRILRLKKVEVCASTRRFDKHGHWRFLGIIARIAWWRATSARRFREQVWRYWYEDR